MTVHIGADRTGTIGPVPRRLFGSFAEHMGRGIYTGIYEPGHPGADAHGFRQDVLELVRELGPTVVRYPGGNFVSSYRWEDGVGPSRPTRLDPAWHSVETNEFGLHEFMAWARFAGVEPMYAVNLGTRGIQEAADVLEYCNHPGGTTLSERRRDNGAESPFDIRLWCLGNEMDGPWQVGHKTADEYGRLAAETARLMRMIDPRVELVVAGSSGADMPTFGQWERTVLTHTAHLVDHLSLHAYYQEHDGDVAAYLASSAALDGYIRATAGIIEDTLAELGLDKRIGISVDEWNVWDQRRWNEDDQPRLRSGPWTRHPRIIEDTYTVTDAVVVGSLLSSLLRNVDRVSMANLAQLVNVIAPIRAEPGGAAWRQTTFHPFQLVTRYARGHSLVCHVDGPRIGEVDVVDVAITADGPSYAVFLTNRDTISETEVRITIDDTLTVHEAVTITPQASRHETSVEPRPLSSVDVKAGTVTATLPPLSWSMLRLTGGADA